MNKVKNLGFIKYLFVFFAFFFLITNLLYSQAISPLYPQFINENKKATIEYLKRIKGLLDFKAQLVVLSGVYKNGFEQEIFWEERDRNQKIKKFEQILQKNLNARDVLYGLYKLYLEKGDNLTAEKYLRQAKEVDPTLK